VPGLGTTDDHRGLPRHGSTFGQVRWPQGVTRRLDPRIDMRLPQRERSETREHVSRQVLVGSDLHDMDRASSGPAEGVEEHGSLLGAGHDRLQSSEDPIGMSDALPIANQPLLDEQVQDVPREREPV